MDLRQTYELSLGEVSETLVGWHSVAAEGSRLAAYVLRFACCGCHHETALEATSQ